MFGRKPKLPIDSMLDQAADKLPGNTPYVNKWYAEVNQDCLLASENSMKSRLSGKKEFDKKCLILPLKPVIVYSLGI